MFENESIHRRGFSVPELENIPRDGCYVHLQGILGHVDSVQPYLDRFQDRPKQLYRVEVGKTSQSTPRRLELCFFFCTYLEIEKREFWDRLENEPERAYQAFEIFLNLTSDKRRY